MNRVLITGAGGYIGSNAALYFLQKGCRVTGMIHREAAPRRLEGTGIELEKAELCDPGSLERLFDHRTYDFVIHIAARADDTGRDEVFRKVNYEAVRQLALLSMKHHVKRFVYLSTSDVYGLHDFHGEGEDDLPLDHSARHPYPKYKILSEEWLRANLPQERFSCVRPCVVWGNGDSTITPRAIAFLKRSPFVFHFGTWKGENRWPLAHVENVCRTLFAAMILPEAGGRGVTVLDSRRTSLREFYHAVAEKYLPGKTLREISLPLWSILPAAWFSSTFSGDKALFDPTLYSLATITHHLDFSNARMLEWQRKAGTEEEKDGTF